MPVVLNKVQNLEPPLGVAYIASVLRNNGHNLKIIDYEVERFSENALMELVRDFSPSLIGVSCRTASYNSAKKIIKFIKERMPDIFVAIGGHHATAFSENSILDTGCDAVVRGEGENTMRELVSSLSYKSDLSAINGLSYKEGGVIKHNPEKNLIENLDELPFPAWDLLPLKKYIVNSIITSRGCPFSCVYCDKAISTREVRFRSAGSVYKEIVALNKLSPGRLFYFVDDFFFLNGGRVKEIFKLIGESDFKINWRCQSRVSPLDLELLPEAKKAGCEQIIFGIETGDPTELIFINKKSTLEDVEKAVFVTKKAGISVRANFMLGFPISTHETVRNTIRFAAKLPIDICRFFIVVPFPNTVLWDYVVKHDLIEAKDIDWASFDLYTTNYKVPALSRYDLQCYSGAAYIHVLKKSILREIFISGFMNFVTLLRLIIRTKRIRGNLSKSFPSIFNLIIELYFLTKNKSFLYKIGFLSRIISIDINLSFNQ